jgi:hypothetical protein
MSLDGRKPATEDLSARMHRKILPAVGLWLFVLGSVWPAGAQRAGTFKGSSDDPAIGYSTTTALNNAVVEVNKKLQDGTVQLSFDGRSGFLKSALEALRIPVDSQLLVFSRTSLQRRLISEQNPRALFFNDRVALGWVRGGDVLEVAAHDESAGVVFYTLEQRVDATTGPPQFKREFVCLGCHVTGSTLGVPGLLMFSTTRPEPSESSGLPRAIDHSDALSRRFGGWFVTGSTGSLPHMGNDMSALDGRSNHELGSVENLFDADGYRALSSDVVAHLVLTHQAGMTNLLTRAGWEARLAESWLRPPFMPTSGQEARTAAVMSGIANELVDYLLFIDEAKLTEGVRGGSGFAERFSAGGPRDRKGRSLYELDLNRRLMKYPCSYLIYSPAFDALPPLAKAPIYRRMWEVLSGQEQAPQYRSALSLADRQSIVEILRDTKNDLPPYFQNVTR